MFQTQFPVNKQIVDSIESRGLSYNEQSEQTYVPNLNTRLKENKSNSVYIKNDLKHQKVEEKVLNEPVLSKYSHAVGDSLTSKIPLEINENSINNDNKPFNTANDFLSNKKTIKQRKKEKKSTTHEQLLPSCNVFKSSVSLETFHEDVLKNSKHNASTIKSSKVRREYRNEKRTLNEQAHFNKHNGDSKRRKLDNEYDSIEKNNG